MPTGNILHATMALYEHFITLKVVFRAGHTFHSVERLAVGGHGKLTFNTEVEHASTIRQSSMR